MTADFYLKDLEMQRAEKVELLKTELSKEDREAVVKSLNSIDARIAEQKKMMTEGKNAFEDIKANLESRNAKLEGEMAAIKDKLRENNITVKGVNESYLESKNSVKDFAECMRAAIDKRGSFQEAWGEKLHTNGIAITEGSEQAFLPTPVKGMIADKWKEFGRVLGYFRNTGAKAYHCRYNAVSQDSTDVRAKGFKSNANKTKTEQTLTLTAKTLTSEFVYKMISISNKTIWEDDTMLIDYVLTELIKQWHYEILRAILVGDGRAANSDDKITTIESIVRAATDVFATKYSAAQGDVSTIEFIMDNAVLPLYDGRDDLVLFVGKDDANSLRKRNNPTGADATYRPLEEVAKEMGVREIVVVPYLTKDEGGNRAICVHGDDYAIVGSLNPSFSSFEEFKRNEVLFRVEIPVGGGLAKPEAAIFVTTPED